jgi:hypothetical protein
VTLLPEEFYRLLRKRKSEFNRRAKQHEQELLQHIVKTAKRRPADWEPTPAV